MDVLSNLTLHILIPVPFPSHFTSWLPERMRASLARLPKALLLVLLASDPYWITKVSALHGDSWCGTLMCVTATLNSSIATCAYGPPQ